jgi:uncharacterized protein YjbJ (UPF0337 family)
MNIDTIAGDATVTKGRFKESLGAATEDPILAREGVADQIFGGLRKAFGAARDFTRNQPIAAAAIAGVLGFSLLRSRRRR